MFKHDLEKTFGVRFTMNTVGVETYSCYRNSRIRTCWGENLEFVKPRDLVAVLNLPATSVDENRPRYVALPE